MTPLFTFDEAEETTEVLCHTCNGWVGTGDGKGFCLCKDLFTYTNERVCRDYVRDKPLIIGDFENGTDKQEAG